MLKNIATERVISEFLKLICGKDAVKMNEALLNNCWIDGDKEMRDDDAYFFAVAEKIQGMMEAKEAELKKL